MPETKLGTLPIVLKKVGEKPVVKEVLDGIVIYEAQPAPEPTPSEE